MHHSEEVEVYGGRGGGVWWEGWRRVEECGRAGGVWWEGRVECGRYVGGWRCVGGLEECGGRVEECGGRGGGMWWEGYVVCKVFRCIMQFSMIAIFSGLAPVVN